MAKITISVIKADIGSIGGHIKPSQRLLETEKIGRVPISLIKSGYSN